ncbi:MAG: hypothetical protein QOD41_2194 [Cryptosporangiaceae bacterium]|nr:hypothetical protein [Cryptosporangiaceae bacterium]
MGWFSDADLRELAGARPYERGSRYLGKILSVTEVPGGAVAVVQGTDPYLVRLGGRDGQLTGGCSCPFAQEGAFCKHCVAVGLHVLGRRERMDTAPLRGYLSSLGADGLADLVLGEAERDPALYRRLAARAVNGPPVGLAERRRAFEAAPDPGTYALLRSAAQEAGEWPGTREWALRILRGTAGDGADPLVLALLGEDDVDGAWAAAAEFGCTTPIRLEVAARRGGTHPADAIGVFIAAIDEVVELKTPGAYQRATGLIGALRILHERAGRDFRCYLDPFKDVHRRKRRFLDELRRAGL